MSKISSVLNAMRPKRKTSKTILLDFDQLPEAYRWLERQAAVHQCSKTAYVKALIEMDRKEQKR